MAKLKANDAQPMTAGDLRPGGNALMQLLSFVERHERLQEERDALGDDQKEIMDEAKGVGFDTKTIRKVIARRKMDAGSREESDAILDLYEQSIQQAEKQQIKESEAKAGDPVPVAAAPAARKPWGRKKDARQTDIEDVAAPSDDDVNAQAARDIGRAADKGE